ncbi:MAG: CpaF family protein [Bdellovibrionaceae bacterium]|nr:CpaF family protein [Pseudobdellovibrionaceae bacterium]
MLNLQDKVQHVVETIKSQSLKEFTFEGLASEPNSDTDFSNWIAPHLIGLSDSTQARLRDEFLGLGPIEPFLKDNEVTEILVNGQDDIWVETKGRLNRVNDRFYTEFTYQLFLNKLLSRIDGVIDKECPILDRPMSQFRICMVDECLTQKNSILSIRRHPDYQWTLDSLFQTGWCSDDEKNWLKTLIATRKRFLIIGPTGCGKTSVINALLAETEPNCRSIIIEDTSEITSVNSCSIKLLTRTQRSQLLDVTQTDLVKSSLRLRPDRIIMGEIRGTEAKDFLMALSTGHEGSFGSLHASDPHQALLRLEMLIQMGAPQWSLEAIRKLIFLSLDGLIVLSKEPNGERIFKGAYQITSLESSGFLLDRWIA